MKIAIRLLPTLLAITLAQTSFAADCNTLPAVSRQLRIKASEILPSGAQGGEITLNGSNLTIWPSDSIRLQPGVNKLELSATGCSSTSYIVAAPRIFFRSYSPQVLPEDFQFDRLFPNAVGVPSTATSAATISNSLRELTPNLDSSLNLGTVFFAQIVDHDMTGNSQFQNCPSTDASVPINLQSPLLDLDNIYGFGRDVETETYRRDDLRFQLVNGVDVPRTPDGIALIADKRDDITGPTLQTHVLLKRYHNYLIRRFLRGANYRELNDRQRRWLFEMVRNKVIGTYQSIIVNELSAKLLGRDLDLEAPALSNIPVEFSAAAFRIGHTLVPDLVTVDTNGTSMSPIEPSLRSSNQVAIPWDLFMGSNAQPAARFDDQIAPVMQELIIPLSPTNPALTEMVGGGADNIGAGRVVNGTLRLDLVETNILRGREQSLPAGEEVLAFLNNTTYNPAAGSTDLFVFILQEAAANNFKFGPVGAFIFEKTIAGILQGDSDSITSRRYSRRDKRRFDRKTLESITNKAFPRSS